MASKQAYCLVSISPVRAEESDASEIVTQLLFGELVEVESINHPWAKITVLSDGYTGYIDHKHVKFLSEKEVRRWNEGLSYLKSREATILTPWGKQRICRGSFIPEGVTEFNIGKDEFQFLNDDLSVSNNIVELAEDYLNTPYLWGGKSPFGIDCSGIVQVVYRFFGFNLPRDASEQVEHGSEVDFEDIEAGDLAYFANSKGKITHVGILDGNGGIIHASGHVRKDHLTKEGIVHAQHGELTHTLTIIKRL